MGISAIGLLTMGIFDYMGDRKIDLVDMMMKWADMGPYAEIIYTLLFLTLALLAIPMFYNIFRKKRVSGGKVFFNEEILYLMEGSERYEIPQQQLDELRFELKKVPEGKEFQPNQPGNYMIIPMSNKEYKYELQLESKDQKQDLLNMVEFLKINHDVKVKVAEVDKKGKATDHAG